MERPQCRLSTDTSADGSTPVLDTSACSIHSVHYLSGLYIRRDHSFRDSLKSLNGLGARIGQFVHWMLQGFSNNLIPILVALVIVQFFGTAADWGAAALDLCEAEQAAELAGEGEGDDAPSSQQQMAEAGELLQNLTCIEMALRGAFNMVCLMAIILHFFCKLWFIIPYQDSNLPGILKRAFPGLDFGARLRADCWIAAASPDMFDETVQILKVCSETTSCLAVPVLCVSLLFLVLAAVDRDAFGCHGSFLCILGAHTCEKVLVLNMALLVAVSISVHTLPPLLWSPTMQQAQEQTGNQRVKMLFMLPSLSVPSYLGALVQLVFYGRHIAIRGEAHFWERLTWLAVGAVCALYTIGILIRQTFILQDFYHLLAGVEVQETHVSASPSRHNIMRDNNSTTSSFAKRLRDLLANSAHVSSRHEEVLLLMTLILLCIEQTSWRPSVHVVVLSVFRYLFLLLLLFIMLRGEKEVQFEDLGPSELQFGLVVKAKELRQALLGKRTRRLPFYSANVLRMQDSLAVSYRWQASKRELMPSLTLNMSDFQLSSLVRAIEKTGVRYVWLDKLSVPQHPGEEQETLLARMMGVYAAASFTLAIRTLETEKNRYHQRGWTFQEFCSSSKVMVITEKGDRRGNASTDMVSVAPFENSQMMTMRDHFQASIKQITPMWLRKAGKTITREQALSVLRAYDTTAPRLTCAIPGDKIRALCPLLAATPVESGQELVFLVQEIARSAGQDLHHWLEALFDRSLVARFKSRSGKRIPEILRFDDSDSEDDDQGDDIVSPGSGVYSPSRSMRKGMNSLRHQRTTIDPTTQVSMRQQAWNPETSKRRLPAKQRNSTAGPATMSSIHEVPSPDVIVWLQEYSSPMGSQETLHMPDEAPGNSTNTAQPKRSILKVSSVAPEDYQLPSILR